MKAFQHFFLTKNGSKKEKKGYCLDFKISLLYCLLGLKQRIKC
jgi:hypothetical protein